MGNIGSRGALYWREIGDPHGIGRRKVGASNDIGFGGVIIKNGHAIRLGLVKNLTFNPQEDK